LIEYCTAEARGLISANIDIADALMSALIAKGTLDGIEVDQIIASCIAARSMKIEHQRRQNWRERETNAAALLKVIGRT
jgi:hypothetical protein